MLRTSLLSLTLVVILSTALPADVVYVDPYGGGDFYTIPAAVAATSAPDTVLVAPCTYFVFSWAGWPVPLLSTAPVIMSEGGADVTILDGDGFAAAFETFDEGARICIIGFTITGTTTPVICPTANFVEFTDNIVTANATGLDIANVMSAGLIARNVFSYNGPFGIRIWHFWGPIEENEIYGNGYGIKGTCCETPLIRNNHIHDNNQGISTGFYATIEGNTVEYNGYRGIGASGGSDSYVRNNIVRYNGTGLLLGYVTGIEVKGNDLCDNTTFDLELAAGGSPGNVDATMNWWGTTDPDEIADHIWDCNDDPGILNCVVFEPCCDAPGCPITPVESLTWGAIKGMYR